jgi:hypothetical protein
MIRPDLEPGFWCVYNPSKSAVGALLQRPATAITADSLASAYMQDFRASRTREKTSDKPK